MSGLDTTTVAALKVKWTIVKVLQYKHSLHGRVTVLIKPQYDCTYADV